MIFSKLLNFSQSLLILNASLIISVLHRLLRVSSAHYWVLSHMSSTDLLNCVGNFADGGTKLGSFDCKFKQIALTRFGALGYQVENFSDCLIVTAGSDLL